MNLLSSHSLKKETEFIIEISGISRVEGSVVQLVRMLPCHGRGRGFESRPVRKHNIKIAQNGAGMGVLKSTCSLKRSNSQKYSPKLVSIFVSSLINAIFLLYVDSHYNKLADAQFCPVGIHKF